MKSINQSVSIKAKELKILNYYKNLGELSNKGLEKTKPIKRTKKNIKSILDTKVVDNQPLEKKYEQNHIYLPFD